MGIPGVRVGEPPEGDPPLQPPRPRQTSKPRVEAEWDNEGADPAETPGTRKLSPPGGIKLEGPGWRVNVSQMALVALLAGSGGAGVAATVTGRDNAALAEELRGLREDVTTLRKELREARADNRAVLAYTRESVTLLGQTVRELGAKVETATGPLPPLELHPAPMPGSHAPRVQPRATLPAPPELGP